MSHLNIVLAKASVMKICEQACNTLYKMLLTKFALHFIKFLASFSSSTAIYLHSTATMPSQLTSSITGLTRFVAKVPSSFIRGQPFHTTKEAAHEQEIWYDQLLLRQNLLRLRLLAMG